MSKRAITLHIERLIFDGITLSQRQRLLLQAALEAELTRLLTNGELALDLQTSGIRHRVPSGSFEIDRADTPEVMGGKLARAIYKGIGQ